MTSAEILRIILDEPSLDELPRLIAQATKYLRNSSALIQSCKNFQYQQRLVASQAEACFCTICSPSASGFAYFHALAFSAMSHASENSVHTMFSPQHPQQATEENPLATPGQLLTSFPTARSELLSPFTQENLSPNRPRTCHRCLWQIGADRSAFTLLLKAISHTKPHISTSGSVCECEWEARWTSLLSRIPLYWSKLSHGGNVEKRIAIISQCASPPMYSINVVPNKPHSQ